MMVTVNQIRDGITLYIEKELVAKVSGLAKWGFAFVGNQLVNTIDIPKYLTMLSVGNNTSYMTSDSLVDIDKLYADFIKVVREQGSVIQHFPVIGDVTFSERDVDLLKSYIYH